MEEIDTDEADFSVMTSEDPQGDPVVGLIGELDISSAGTFRESMEELLGQRATHESSSISVS